MNYEQESVKAEEFFAEGLATLVSKAHDYAQEEDCFSNFKLTARLAGIPVEKVFMVFLSVKIARLSELVGGKEAQNESIQETLKDLTNYACLMSIYLGNKQ
jgi:hypothetical protein